MTQDELAALSWLIGWCNPLSAVLVGPALAWVLTKLHVRPIVQRRVALVGWLVLGVAQIAFLVFGFGGGFPGFKFAQPLMIPISLANFAASWFLMARLNPKPPAVERVAEPAAADGVAA